MSALSPLFLWLIPLALLPVLIHLLNRLRYQTVKWAAMMFLRSADRDASRRAKLRQWLILAARCLMLLMFLLALSRLQSKGRLARFFDPGSNLVVILFDRSASMEQLRGGVSGRERALTLLNQGLSELGPGSRVIWMDSATGERTPLPASIDLNRLPMVSSSETSSDVSAMLRAALQEIARAGVSKAEIWIPTDRQSSAWLPDGSNPPDWSAWVDTNTQITLRLLDIAQVEADRGNRSLELVSEPIWDGESLSVNLRMTRDTPQPESVALQIDFGGLSVREDLLVEGLRFTWEQTLPVASKQLQVHALFSLPSDSNSADNRVAVSWLDQGAALALVDTGNSQVNAVTRAGLLPRDGFREVVERGEPDTSIFLIVQSRKDSLPESLSEWLMNGGVLLQLPEEASLVSIGEDENGVGVESWVEASGVLATEQREPLRLDLVRVYARDEGFVFDPEKDTLLASLEGGQPLLTRRGVGEGALYRLSSLPLPPASNLDAGYVWVPFLQRLLQEGGQDLRRFGTFEIGEKTFENADEWEPLDTAGRSPILNVGRYRGEGGVRALNRAESENRQEQLSVSELKAWASPLDLRVFEDRSEANVETASRFEFTSLLILLGLLFLVIESWLLTRNIRRPSSTSSSWRATA